MRIVLLLSYCSVVFMPGVALAQGSTHQPEILSANRFRFEIAGKAIPNVSKVMVGAVKIPLVAFSLGGDSIKRYLPGRPVYGNVRIEKAADNDATFKDIAKAAATATNPRRDAALILLSATGAELKRFTFLRCLPVKYEPGDIAPPTGLIRESLELVPERVEMSIPNTLKVSDLMMSVKFSGITRSRGLSATRFTVDFKGPTATATESTWKSVKGGGIQFETITVTSGADRIPVTTLGRQEPTELELTGPAHPAAHIVSLGWLREILVGGANPRRTVTVNIYAQDGSIIAKRTYSDCLITSYNISTFDSASSAEVEERITIKPGVFVP